MDSRGLITEIAARSGIPYDDVQTVLEHLNVIVREKIGVYESVVVPKLMKIGCKYHQRYGWQLHIATYRQLHKAVGLGVERLTTPPTTADPR